MASNSFLLVGGLGFVGKNLCEYLAGLGHKLAIFDLKSPSQVEQDLMDRLGVTFIQGSVLDEDQVMAVIQDGKYDGVYNLASFVGIKNYIARAADVILTTINGTHNVAKACAATGTHLIFTSTSEVLGKNPDTPWTEEADRVYGATSVDRWSYGSSKGVAEQLLVGMARQVDLSFTIIRFFNVYGPYQNPIFVMSKSINNVLNGQSPLVYDDGTQTRCFTYIGDAVVALDRLMTAKAEGIYHIGSNFEHTVSEVVQAVIDVAERPDLTPETLVTQDLYKGNTYEDIQRRVPDVSKIKRDYDWAATTTMTQGVAKTIDWARQHDWWLTLDSSVEA